jgi:2-hydroxymuconate-semialdehyde hydrolase
VQTGGAGTSAYMCWYPNLPVFAAAAYHVYAPDVIGFGHTEITRGGPVSPTEFLLTFMEGMGVGRAHFVGNSMGSMMICRLAVDHPGRVKSLILTGGEPRVETEESQRIARDLGKTPRMEFVRQMLSRPAVTFQDMRRATADFFYDPDHPSVDEISAMRLAILQKPGVQEREREAAFKQIAGGRFNYSASDLRNIRAPTSLIHGRDERFFYPADVASILLECAVKAGFAIPDCSCTLLPRCGHWPQIEKAEVFNRLSLVFLDQVK